MVASPGFADIAASPDSDHKRWTADDGIRQSSVATVSAAVDSPIGKWRRHVVSIPNVSYSGNPFELEIDATFTHASSGTSITLSGYFAGNDAWNVGFMPTEVGDWTYVTSSPDPDLDGVTGSVVAVESGLPGVLKADMLNARKWKYTDGSYVVPLALRFDLFHEDGTIERFTEVADFLANDVEGQMLEFTFRNEVYSDWQNHEFDLTLWDRLEQRMEILAERGLGIHFMLYSDDAQEPNWPANSATEELFIRYLVARLSGYPVVWFNSGIDIAEYRDQAWTDWYGQQIESLDPYSHPVSSRRGGGSGTLVMAGKTFDSRDHDQAIISDMTDYFQISDVPVSMDDAWSENAPNAAARGKDFTEHDIRRAIWKTVMAGGLGAIIRGSVYYNEDLWFRMDNIEEDLESEQFLGIINPFIDTKLGDTFGAMVPEPSLVFNGYAIADSARAEILYFLVGQNDKWDFGNGGDITVRLSGLTGSYAATWLDTRTGIETPFGSLAGGTDHVLTPPSEDDWVLSLTKTGGGGNSAPNANDQSVTISVDATTTVALSYSDSDGPGPYTFTIVLDPSNGVLSSVQGGEVTYTPSTGFTGSDSFRWKVNDGLDDSSEATVSITVTDELVVSGLSAASGKTYDVLDGGLSTGQLVYTDRAYTFTSIPAWLVGATYIRTANDDKFQADENFLTFSISRDAMGYVAYDTRATLLPDWLSAWTDTGEEVLGTTDVSLRIYTVLFPAGAVSLGGNLASGAFGAQTNYSVSMVPTIFPVLPGMTSHAKDHDGDGLAEDTNGNGHSDFADVVALFEHLDSSQVQNNQAAFDFNGNGVVDMGDIAALFDKLVA